MSSSAVAIDVPEAAAVAAAAAQQKLRENILPIIPTF